MQACAYVAPTSTNINKEIRFSYLSKLGFYNGKSDEEYLGRLFEYSLGYKLNLSDPKTYNQELKRLVRELYNLPTDREPPLGGRPRWLDFPTVDTSMAEERAKAMAQLVRKNPDADTLMVKAADDLLRVLNGLAEAGYESETVTPPEGTEDASGRHR